MSDHYGYIRRTEGADGDQVDVYIGPHPDSEQGFTSEAAAVKAYRSNFDQGWKVGPVRAMTMGEFKAWLKAGDTSRPIAESGTETGEFGPIHAQYRHDAEGAIKRLLADKTGEAPAALHHPGVGDIGLVYGRTLTSDDEGLGLAKIAAKHPEVLGDLQGFLDGMRKNDAKSGSNRIRA